MQKKLPPPPESPLINEHPHDLIRMFRRAKVDEQEHKEYKKEIRDALAAQAMRNPDKKLETPEGVVEAYCRSNVRSWDQSALLRVVCEKFEAGELDHLIQNKEATKAFQLGYLIDYFFTISPLKSIEALNINYDNYSTVKQERRWDISLKEKK